MTNIPFNKYYKRLGFISIILVIISLSLLFFKGLNYGVDFKGGTLIEIRIQNSDHSVSKVRDVFSDSNLPNLTVKNFGNDTDYIIKFQKQNLDNPEYINDLKNEVLKSFPDPLSASTCAVPDVLACGVSIRTIDAVRIPETP